jgi:hypothetical protein
MRYKSGYILCMLIGWLGSFAQAAPPEARLPESHLALFETYCYECHDSVIEEGEVNLETISFNLSEDLKTAETWQKVLNALNSGEMPPEDEPQISNSEKTALLDDLSNRLAGARKILSDSGGKITMRRLNRREYLNTVKELTGAFVDVSSLPSDVGAGTFDTVGASLFISSDQFEQYLELGRAAIDEAFERQAAQQEGPKVFRVEPETSVNVQSLKVMRDYEEVRERFFLWKAGVDKAVEAPENREIVARILKKNPTLDPSAFPAAPGYQFYLHAQELIGAPDPVDFGFRDDNRAVFLYQGGYIRRHALLKHYAELPRSDRGTYLKTAWGIQRIDVSPDPQNLPPGTYNLRVRAGTVEGSPSTRHFIDIGHPQHVNNVPAGFAALPISSHQVTGTTEQPEIIETQMEVGLHTQREFGIQGRQPTDLKTVRNSHNEGKRVNGYGVPPAVWVDWIELEGPLPSTAPRSALEKVFAKHSDTNGKSENDRARAILIDFSYAAFRRVNPDTKFLDQLVGIFEVRRKSGEAFDLAIRTPLSVILASPGFLYLNEPGSEDAPRLLDDRELAVRLAYFLWSAPPDVELLELAERNKLSKPTILREQVDRMIADSRSDEFVSGFVHQWLDMERLDFFQFDLKLHREFDESSRASAREEVYQSFAYLLRDSDNGRLGKLLDSDYVVINGLLATYYGIEDVSGDAFRKVALPANSPRGGLLGMAAIHAMGSDGVNSSPVERGAWVLRHLLNNPPPPAPPNVPQISRLNDQVLTTRERLSAHMKEAQCASCHRKIDPIGFGLENFNAAGKWRTQDFDGEGKRKKVWDIDASGAFHKGPAFGDYYELRNQIAHREDDFARGFAEHLIGYALGRPFGFTDEDLANEIVSSAKKDDYPVSAFVHALVRSEVFRKK